MKSLAVRKLRSFIADKGLEQKDLAEAVKEHPSTICRLLKGLHEPKVGLAVALEKATKGHIKCHDWTVP